MEGKFSSIWGIGRAFLKEEADESIKPLLYTLKTSLWWDFEIALDTSSKK
jgi:hypothetical protein